MLKCVAQITAFRLNVITILFIEQQHSIAFKLHESEMIMNENILKLLNTDTDFYPANLEQKFPHILEKIVNSWGKPEFDAIINKLMLDTRDHMRHGFPPEVAGEILHLSRTHTAQQSGSAEKLTPKSK